MNNNIPIFNPFCTTNVCNPVYVASRITSLHHAAITNNTNTKDKINNHSPYAYLCIYNTPPTVKPNAPIDPTNGHGLGSTK